jgi:hypothetical protein
MLTTHSGILLNTLFSGFMNLECVLLALLIYFPMLSLLVVFDFQLIEKCVRECVSSITHLFSNVVFTGLMFLHLVRGSL